MPTTRDKETRRHLIAPDLLISCSQARSTSTDRLWTSGKLDRGWRNCQEESRVRAPGDGDSYRSARPRLRRCRRAAPPDGPVLPVSDGARVAGLFDDSDATRETVKQILAFLQFHLGVKGR